MFVGAFELLLVSLLVFVIVGPKDFPKVMFWIGDVARKIRGMGRQFYKTMEDLSENADFSDEPIRRKDSQPKGKL